MVKINIYARIVATPYRYSLQHAHDINFIIMIDETIQTN